MDKQLFGWDKLTSEMMDEINRLQNEIKDLTAERNNLIAAVESKLHCVNHFNALRQHTLGMIHLNGRIVVPEDK